MVELILRAVAVLAISWLVAGCSLVTPYEAPSLRRAALAAGGVPAGLEKAAVPLAAAAERQWPPETTKLTLGQAIDRALAKNLDQKLAEAEEQVRLARFQAEKGTLLPVLGIGGGVLSQDGEVQGSFGKLRDIDVNRVNPSYGLVYDVNFLRRIEAAYARRRDLDAQVLRTLDTEQRLMLRVAELYENLVLAKGSVRIAGKIVESSEKILAIARTRVEAGTGKASDVARAEARVAADRRLLVSVRNLWEQKSVALAVVLRLPPGKLLEPAETELRPRALAPGGAAWDPGRAAASRPDVQAARHAAAGADHATDAAWWDLLAPRVQAVARESFIGTRWGNLNKRLDWGLALAWELSFSKLSRVKEARAVADLARLRLARLEERAAGEVETARREIEAAHRAIELARSGLEAATRNLAIHMALFEKGQVLVLEVLDARETLAQAELDLARSITTYNLAQTRLLTAAGALSRDAFD